MFSCEYCETFKSTYFEEHLRTAASRTSVLYEITTFIKMLFLLYNGFYLTSNHNSKPANPLQKKKHVEAIAGLLYYSCFLKFQRISVTQSTFS